MVPLLMPLAVDRICLNFAAGRSVACVAGVQEEGVGDEMSQRREETSVRSTRGSVRGTHARTLMFSSFHLLIKYTKPIKL